MPKTAIITNPPVGGVPSQPIRSQSNCFQIIKLCDFKQLQRVKIYSNFKANLKDVAYSYGLIHFCV